MEKITAKISGVVFSNKENGFYILKAIPDGKKSNMTIKGTFPGSTLGVGLKSKFSGKWVTHATYGKQFMASTCEVIPENGKSGVVTYLMHNVFSIGPITADKLYDHFGDDLISILDNESERLKEAQFLTKPQLDNLIKEWTESSEKRTSAIFLGDLGIGSAQIKTIFLKFGPDAKKIITENPYCLAECAGVGFATADQAARKLGIGVDDPRRLKAMIIAALYDLSMGDGHVYADSNQIKSQIQKMFRRNSLDAFSHGEEVPDSKYYVCLTELEEDKQIHIEDGAIYSSVNWAYESSVAEHLSKILNQPPKDLGDLEECMNEFEEFREIKLSDDQKTAFLQLHNSRVCAISGYPGTGKTLLMSLFVHLFEKNRLDYKLMSPTGIAAKRLSQLTGKPAFTIHRALGCGHDGSWEFNRSNKYMVDAVVLDETSMVDNATFYRLVSALPETTILILVGDAAQLPSVGAGQVLDSLLNCASVPHTRLTHIYRQADHSGIIDAAHQILNGENVNTKFDKDSDFVCLRFKPNETMKELCKITREMKVRDRNFQVIAPVYNGELGVNNLNKELRDVLNDNFIGRDNYSGSKIPRIKQGDSDIFEGDRVMVVKNDYTRMIFNGDIGKVERILIKKNAVEVKIFDWFDQESSPSRYIDKVFSFSFDEAKIMLKVAYACTAHRSQGQEFDYILLPMTMEYRNMLYRNLVYTAITRAKKKVFLFGDMRAFSLAVSNDKETSRNTKLSHLIADAFENTRAEQIVDG